MKDVIIVPKGLDEYWCEFCMAYKYQEIRRYADGHHFENGKIVLHVKAGTLCLDCGYLNSENQ
jgi:hypothetical protein